MRHRDVVILPVLFLVLIPCAFAQTSKEINDQAQFWWSLNTTARLTDRWGMVADFHIRRNDFTEDPSFYFIRFGSNLWITQKLTFTAGYAHMWQAPAHENWNTWLNEDRVYQQFQYSSKIGNVSVLNRLRNEQRWRQKIANDVRSRGRSFSNRIRYLASFSIPISRNPSVPLLALSDEILLQFGNDIVNNTFDQNRPFVGIKKSLTPSWSFDFGYMPVLQQKPTGYQYDLNHTLRMFFYFSPDFTKEKSTHDPASHEE